MPFNPQEHLIKQAVANTLGKCSACQHPYGPENVSIIGHQEDLWFLSLSCSRCHAQGLVAALVKEQSIEQSADEANQEIATERPEAPRPRIGERERRPGRERRRPSPPTSPINADDVQAMRDYLQDFDGDFATLFSRH